LALTVSSGSRENAYAESAPATSANSATDGTPRGIQTVSSTKLAEATRGFSTAAVVASSHIPGKTAFVGLGVARGVGAQLGASVAVGALVVVGASVGMPVKPAVVTSWHRGGIESV